MMKEIARFRAFFPHLTQSRTDRSLRVSFDAAYEEYPHVAGLPLAQDRKLVVVVYEEGA